MKKLLFLPIVILFLFPPLLMAQENTNTESPAANDAGNGNSLQNVSQEDLKTEENIDNILLWSDPLYIQLERMLPRLASSLGRLDNRVSSLALIDVNFSPDLSRNFQKVALHKIFGKILQENSRLKLIDCEECNQIKSEISGGILRITRGFGDAEGRKAVAKKLNLEGFMTLAVLLNDRQLSIIVNVKDAVEGRTVLSDVITGTPLPETTYYNVYVGQMSIPVTLNAKADTTATENTTSEVTPTIVDEKAAFISLEKSVRFSESWLFNVTITAYYDNNTKLADNTYEPISVGLLFDGTISWEMFAMESKNAALSLALGMGEFISPQFNFSLYGKVGAKLVVGQALTFNAYYLAFYPANGNMTKPDATTGLVTKYGSGITVLGLGYQF